MMDKKYFLAKKLLIGCRLSIVNATRLIKNILDAKPSNSPLTDIQFVAKVIEVGLRNIRNTEKSFEDGFKIYLESKQHLRPDSIRDIRCIGNRLIRTSPELGERNFSELSVSECEEWLNAAFHTDNQFKRSANEISPQAKDPKGETAHKVSASQVLKVYRPIKKLLKAMYLPLGNLKKPSAKEPNKLTRRSLVWN